MGRFVPRANVGGKGNGWLGDVRVASVRMVDSFTVAAGPQM